MNEQQHVEIDWAGAYVLDALAEDEARAFELHLRTCDTCRSEVHELRQVADLLPLAVESVEPPPRLRERILTEIRSVSQEAPQEQTPGAPTPIRFPGLRERLRQPMAWAAAVAAAIIIGLGAWNISLQQQVHNNSPQSAVADYLAHGASGWPVAGTALDPAATGTLLQPRNKANAVFILSGLSPSPANHVYQVWFMRGNRPTSAGTFTVSASGTQVVHLLHPSIGFQLTAITVEPGPHGSAGPTTKPVLFGKLGA